MKLLDDYFKLQKEIYDYFGYQEDWVVIPLEDATEYVWTVEDDHVSFADNLAQLQDEKVGQYYENEIYTQCHLPKYVYRGKDYTMICVDTHIDGNKFLQIFDNTKEVTTATSPDVADSTESQENAS